MSRTLSVERVVTKENFLLWNNRKWWDEISIIALGQINFSLTAASLLKRRQVEDWVLALNQS